MLDCYIPGKRALKYLFLSIIQSKTNFNKTFAWEYGLSTIKINILVPKIN